MLPLSAHGAQLVLGSVADGTLSSKMTCPANMPNESRVTASPRMPTGSCDSVSHRMPRKKPCRCRASHANGGHARHYLPWITELVFVEASVLLDVGSQGDSDSSACAEKQAMPLPGRALLRFGEKQRRNHEHMGCAAGQRRTSWRRSGGCSLP